MKNVKVFRYLAYSLEILLLFVFGTTPHLIPEIFGSTPCFLVALALAIAVFESQIPAMFIGLFCGLLTDIGYSNSVGFFTVMLTVICFALGFCSNNLITIKFYTVMLIATLVITALLTLHFVFEFVINGYDYLWVYYVNHYISRIMQTILCVIPLFFVNKFIYSTLN